MIATLLEFIKLVGAIVSTGKSAYEFYQEVFGNNKGGLAAMVQQLTANITAIMHMELEQQAITNAQAAAQTGVDFLSINLPDEVTGHSNEDIFTYLNGPDASNALNDADTQANTMEMWSLQTNLTDQETMQAIQTLPLYLLLGNICLSIYQARAVFATEDSDKETNWKNISNYATRFQNRASQILGVLTAARATYVSSTVDTESEGSNPPYSSYSEGWLDMKDTLISSHSMLKYWWSIQTNEGGTKSNYDLVNGQINSLISLHCVLLGSPTNDAYNAILQAASKSDQLPAATHFEDYFTKHPAFPPTGGYVEEVYQFAVFVTSLQTAINALGQTAANPSQLQPPSAPSYDIFGEAFENNQPGPGPWVPGYSVQYSVSFYMGSDPTNPDYESPMGAWSAVISSQGYYYPHLTEIEVDPTGLATGRKIYRQFQGATTEYIGSLPDNTTTVYLDTSNGGTPVGSGVKAVSASGTSL